VTASPLEKPLSLIVYFYSQYFNISNAPINRNLSASNFDLSVCYVRINLTERQWTVEDAGPYSVEMFVHIYLAVRRR